jgi:hypothetical protein
MIMLRQQCWQKVLKYRRLQGLPDMAEDAIFYTGPANPV